MASRSSFVAFIARNNVVMTSWVFEESLALMRATVSVNRPFPMKMSVSSAKKQKISRAMEVVHVGAVVGRAPFGVVFQEFNIKPVEAAGGADVKRVFGDLSYRRDSGQRQKEAEMVGEILVGAGDGFAAGEVLGFEMDAVGCQNELGFGFARRGAFLQCLKVFVTCPASQVTMWTLLV